MNTKGISEGHRPMGRRRVDPSERLIAQGVTLKPDQWAFIYSRSENASRYIQQLVERDMQTKGA
jgi:hypothetical protein